MTKHKLLHILAGALIFALVLPFGFWWAVGLAIGGACVKELYDLRTRDGRSAALADAELVALGVATAAGWLCVVAPFLAHTALPLLKGFL